MTLPETMKAMVLTAHGDLDKYEEHEDGPVPQPDPMEVLIKAGACGLNNTGVNTCSGWYSKTVEHAATGGALEEAGAEDPTGGGRPLVFPRTQGADAVGEVVAAGKGAGPAPTGKRVRAGGWVRDWDGPLNKDKAGYFGSECDGGFAGHTKAGMRGVAGLDPDLILPRAPENLRDALGDETVTVVADAVGGTPMAQADRRAETRRTLYLLNRDRWADGGAGPVQALSARPDVHRLHRDAASHLHRCGLLHREWGDQAGAGGGLPAGATEGSASRLHCQEAHRQHHRRPVTLSEAFLP